MGKIRLLHTSDLHIGDRRYGRFDPKRSINTRLDDQRKCLEFLAAKCAEMGVHAAIVAGDIYHGKTPGPAEEDIFAAFVASLTSGGIHVFVLAGNHERPVIPGRASPLTHISTLGIDNFHLISEPEAISVGIGKETLTVAGLPWPHRRELVERGMIAQNQSPTPEIWDSYISGLIEGFAGKIPEGSVPVLAAHLWTSGVRGVAERNIRGEPLCRTETLAVEPFRYVALGHIHAHQQLWQDPPVVYSGSIDRTDFSEATDPKGAVIVDIDSDSAELGFLETPARRFVTVEMDLSGVSDPLETAADRVLAHNIEDAVVRVIATQAPGDPPFDSRHLRPKLPEPYYLRVIRRETAAEEKPLILPAFNPIAALEAYIDESDNLRPHKDELLALAKELAAEVRAG